MIHEIGQLGIGITDDGKNVVLAFSDGKEDVFMVLPPDKAKLIYMALSQVLEVISQNIMKEGVILQ